MVMLNSSCEKSAEAVQLGVIGELHLTGEKEDANARQGSFSLLIYNIAGLPWVVSSSSPVENIPQIGPFLNKYDIVLLQEDFWYHDTLIPKITLPYQSEPQDLEPSVFDLHDGLSRFSKFRFHKLARKTWEACAGYLTDSCDCLARKGYSSAMMTIGEGTSILVYNVHFDAGEADSDILARKAQFRQLAEDIKNNANGKPIIVAGDINLEAKAPTDIVNFNTFIQETGLQDSCEKFPCEGELFDKILIRSSKNFVFTMKSRNSPTEFVNEENEALSDHRPVSIVLDWNKAGNL